MHSLSPLAASDQKDLDGVAPTSPYTHTHHAPYTLMERPTVNAQQLKRRGRLILHCAIQRVEILNVQRVDGILVKLSILSILLLVFVVVLLLLRLPV